MLEVALPCLPHDAGTDTQSVLGFCMCCPFLGHGDKCMSISCPNPWLVLVPYTNTSVSSASYASSCVAGYLIR